MGDDPQQPSPVDAARAHELHQLACRIRGEFLNGTAWMDVLLTDILSHYFCADKQRRMFFFTEVAAVMSFRSKTSLLEKILKQEFPELVTKYPRLRDRLDSLREFRNVLAHNHLDTSDQSLAKRRPDEVVFVKYKLGKISQVRINATDAGRRAKEANQLRRELLELQRRFFRSNESSRPDKKEATNG
jgi:hypothetical protein